MTTPPQSERERLIKRLRSIVTRNGRTIRIPEFLEEELSQLVDLILEYEANLWKTPEAVYQVLNDEFHFDHDPCPPDYIVDGLTSEWGQSNFVNPPYGRELPKWVTKGYEQAQLGKTVVLLIPSRTDTRWWHDYCMKANEICFIKGRLKFEGAVFNAPFPSVIVIFKAIKAKEKE